MFISFGFYLKWLCDNMLKRVYSVGGKSGILEVFILSLELKWFVSFLKLYWECVSVYMCWKTIETGVLLWEGKIISIWLRSFF